MNTPIWEIFRDTSGTPVNWVVHGPNRRFSIHALGTRDPADDVVLDRETGLVWPRRASLGDQPATWLDACTTARECRLALRLGWRLPTIEELSTLVDTTRTGPALPVGHPFIGVRDGSGSPGYWTATNHEQPGSGVAWFLNIESGTAGLLGKGNPAFVWPVRGGRGPANWNP